MPKKTSGKKSKTKKAAKQSMATTTRSSARKATPSRKNTTKRGAGRKAADTLLGPIKGSTARVIGGVTLDAVRAGAARVKRMIYPAGFRWSEHMKPVTGTDRCMHAHVGFLAKGEIHIEYEDGCVVELRAPQVVAIDPGHDGWVVGREPVVLIEFDFERETVNRLGMPDAHRH